jgi:hypothetical protein
MDDPLAILWDPTWRTPQHSAITVEAGVLADAVPDEQQNPTQGCDWGDPPPDESDLVLVGNRPEREVYATDRWEVSDGEARGLVSVSFLVDHMRYATRIVRPDCLVAVESLVARDAAPFPLSRTQQGCVDE